MSPNQKSYGLYIIMIIVVVVMGCLCMSPCRAWSFEVTSSTHPKVLKKSFWAMDTEGPGAGLSSSTTTTTTTTTTAASVPSLLQIKWKKYRIQQQQNQKRQKFNKFSSSVSAIGKLPWIDANDKTRVDSSSNVFLTHWNWQLDFFEQHLTNLRVNPQQYIEPLMYVENDSHVKSNDSSSSQQQRIYTISLQSNEYRDIRMTYLHCGDDQSQIFRCTCYPHNDMPILGMGLMQLGQQRNVAIIDFQPLLSSSQQQSIYIRRLEQIRSSFPSMQQPMSNRHFDPNEQRYFTAHPIIGKWTSQDENSPQYCQDLQTVHQQCVQTHVQLTQQQQQSYNRSMEDRTHHNCNRKRDYVYQLHSDYDTFVASKEPASQLLSAAFGKDVAHRLVHQVIFPLSQQQQQQQHQQPQ
jgi:15,16-dihydrobiliverdin:ferredoxin oxidoreductase